MKAIVHEVDRKCKQGQLKMKYREQVKRNMRRISLRKQDVADQCRWRGVGRITEAARCIQPPPFTKDI